MLWQSSSMSFPSRAAASVCGLIIVLIGREVCPYERLRLRSPARVIESSGYTVVGDGGHGSGVARPSAFVSAVSLSA